jgi:hypothetical protein
MAKRSNPLFDVPKKSGIAEMADYVKQQKEEAFLSAPIRAYCYCDGTVTPVVADLSRRSVVPVIQK